MEETQSLRESTEALGLVSAEVLAEQLYPSPLDPTKGTREERDGRRRAREFTVCATNAIQARDAQYAAAEKPPTRWMAHAQLVEKAGSTSQDVFNARVAFAIEALEACSPHRLVAAAIAHLRFERPLGPCVHSALESVQVAITCAEGPEALPALHLARDACALAAATKPVGW